MVDMERTLYGFGNLVSVETQEVRPSFYYWNRV